MNRDEANRKRAEQILPSIYNKIFEYAKCGKSFIEITIQFSEPAEFWVLHLLKEAGYDVQIVSAEPIVARISWF
jgi:hypothetical protein